MTRLGALLFVALITGATCSPAGPERPMLLFRPGHANVAVARGEKWQRDMLPEAIAWWEREVDADWLSLSDPIDADVVVAWEPVGLGRVGECAYLEHPRRVSLAPGRPLDVTWQALLHELGHCAAGLTHHWSRASIMFGEVPTQTDPHRGGFGAATRIWFGVLPGERDVVRQALE